MLISVPIFLGSPFLVIIITGANLGPLVELSCDHIVATRKRSTAGEYVGEPPLVVNAAQT